MSSIQRIGAFFDGTGNNKDNDNAINDGSLTNIGKLHDAYGGKAFYVEGVENSEDRIHNYKLSKFFDKTYSMIVIDYKKKQQERNRTIFNLIIKYPVPGIYKDIFNYI